MRRELDIVPTEEATAFAYLTDSTETNRVRAAVEVGTIVEMRCAVVNRVLTLNERTEWRNLGVLPGEVGVNPQVVECSVTAPDGSKSALTVQRRATGIFVTTIEATRAGGWVYRFSGYGGHTISERRAFDVR